MLNPPRFKVSFFQTFKKVCALLVVPLIFSSCAIIWDNNPLNFWNYVKVDPEKSFRLDKTTDTPNETWGKKFTSFQKEVSAISPDGKTIPIIIDPRVANRIVLGWKGESSNSARLPSLPAMDALRQVCAEHSLKLTVMDNGVLVSD